MNDPHDEPDVTEEPQDPTGPELAGSLRDVRLVGALLLAATAAALGLVVVYVRGGQPQLEGALLLVEQYVHQAVRYADRLYALRRGQVVVQGRAQEVAPLLEEAYLAGAAHDDAERA